MVQLVCSQRIRSAGRGLRILTNITIGTRMNKMVIGALGTKIKKT